MPSRSAAEPPPARRFLGRGIGSPLPWTALAAAVSGFFAVVPLGLMAVLLFALGGLSSDGAREPWVWVVFLAPVVQLAATVWLLLRRGWIPLLIAVLPSAALVVAVYTAAADSGDGVGVGVGPLLLILFPLLAAGLAAAGPTRRWLAGSPRRTT